MYVQAYETSSEYENVSFHFDAKYLETKMTENKANKQTKLCICLCHGRVGFVPFEIETAYEEFLRLK